MSKLEFVPNPAEESEGMNHSGIAIFKGSAYAATARECGQNSADAHLSIPVEIKFDHTDIPSSELPDLGQYKKAVSLCLENVRKLDDDKGMTFFSRAQKVLEQGRIHILTISDFNTRGLRGPSKEGTPFHSLLKGSGSSVKDSDVAGGSFGIGKFAPFCISELQTVFYSTIYQDSEGKNNFLAQGRSIFISHLDENKEPKKQIGYWGGEGFQPLNQKNLVPDWMKRNEQGTSLHVIGFKVIKDWHHRMAASLITNFFSAIANNQMKFSLNNGEIIIDDKSIATLFNDPKIEKAADESNKRDDFDFSKNLLECLGSKETLHRKISIEGLGQVSLKVLIKENLPKKLAIVRNGMIITDNLKNFGESFQRFRNYSDFIAIVEPVDTEGNALMRTLENPEHNDFSSERILDDTKQQYAQRVMKKLARKIREEIKKEAQTEPEDEIILDELSEFFADSGNEDKIPDPAAETNPETYKYKPQKKSGRKTEQKPVPVDGEGEEGGAGGEDDSGGSGGNGTGAGTGDGTGGKGKKRAAFPLKIYNSRNFFTSEGNFNKRRIFFTPNDTCTAKLKISATGIADIFKLTMNGTDNGSIENGDLKIPLIEGKRIKLDIEFLEQYEGPIEIAAIRMEGTDNENR